MGIETIKKEEKDEKKEKDSKDRRIGCPICGDKDNLVPDGRCVYCLNCGWSKCSL